MNIVVNSVVTRKQKAFAYVVIRLYVINICRIIIVVIVLPTFIMVTVLDATAVVFANVLETKFADRKILETIQKIALIVSVQTETQFTLFSLSCYFAINTMSHMTSPNSSQKCQGFDIFLGCLFGLRLWTKKQKIVNKLQFRNPRRWRLFVRRRTC